MVLPIYLGLALWVPTFLFMCNLRRFLLNSALPHPFLGSLLYFLAISFFPASWHAHTILSGHSSTPLFFFPVSHLKLTHLCILIISSCIYVPMHIISLTSWATALLEPPMNSLFCTQFLIHSFHVISTTRAHCVHVIYLALVELYLCSQIGTWQLHNLSSLARVGQGFYKCDGQNLRCSTCPICYLWIYCCI